MPHSNLNHHKQPLYNKTQAINISPRPHHNPYSQLQTMPEKQKKQIEFIDQIYQKVVVNSSSRSNKPIREQCLQ
jgi:hypothetical protein